jgi:predicted nuclease of predicted toxin-antitoxin system
VKLLFDENLSRKLVIRLAELYPESAHVVEAGLLESPDREV